jgi:6-phosphogluconolactonase (cycloisomerase 2 family)
MLRSCLAFLCLLCAQSTVSAQVQKFVYAANFGGGSSVSGFSLNGGTGALTPVPGSPFAAGDISAYVVVDPTARFVYVANAMNTFGIYGYSLNQVTGALTPVPGSPFSPSVGVRTLTVDPTGTFLYAPNPAGTVVAYAVNGAGSLTPISSSNVQASRIEIHPSGRFAYAIDGAIENVRGFGIDPVTKALQPLAGTPVSATGSPRTLVLDPTGRFAYVGTCNGPSSVHAYAIDANTGAISPVAGSPFRAGACPQTVALDPQKRFLYAGNWVDNTISVFNVDGSSGALMQVSGSPFPSGGYSPNTIAPDATGNFLYVGNVNSQSIAAFTVGVSGTLIPVAGSPFLSTPNSSNPEWIATVPALRGPVLSANPASVTFPDQQVGTTSAVRTVTISNTGSSTASISGITVTGEFQQNYNCGATLPAGSSCAIYLTFSPQGTGMRNGTLSIAGSAPITVGLSGNGIAPMLTLSSKALTFPLTRIGNSSDSQLITLSNTGTAAAQVSSITSSSAEFFRNHNCPTTLPPGGVCTVAVSFKPSSIGSRSGQLLIGGDLNSNSGVVTLKGFGFTVIEAEAPTNVLRGKTRVTACSACSGGAMVDRFDASGSLTISGVSAPAAGSYNITAYVVNTSNKSITLSLSVNGGALSSVAVAPTGGSVGQVRIPVTFVNGGNSIKFSNAASGTVGLDRIAIE